MWKKKIIFEGVSCADAAANISIWQKSIYPTNATDGKPDFSLMCNDSEFQKVKKMVKAPASEWPSTSVKTLNITGSQELIKWWTCNTHFFPVLRERCPVLFYLIFLHARVMFAIKSAIRCFLFAEPRYTNAIILQRRTRPTLFYFLFYSRIRSFFFSHFSQPFRVAVASFIACTVGAFSLYSLRRTTRKYETKRTRQKSSLEFRESILNFS